MSVPRQYAYLVVQELYSPPGVVPQGRRVTHECISHSLDGANAMLEDTLCILGNLQPTWTWRRVYRWEDRGDVMGGFAVFDEAGNGMRIIFIEKILLLEACVVDPTFKVEVKEEGAGVKIEG